MIAHRTSPTNIGLYLLAVLSAREFGWIGIEETVTRLENTMSTLDRLERFQGHFLNWYDTTTGEALFPRYVSSVDSGNLAGHLLAVSQGCERLRNLSSGRRGPGGDQRRSAPHAGDGACTRPHRGHRGGGPPRARRCPGSPPRLAGESELETSAGSRRAPRRSRESGRHRPNLGGAGRRRPPCRPRPRPCWER